MSGLKSNADTFANQNADTDSHADTGSYPNAHTDAASVLFCRESNEPLDTGGRRDI